MPDPAACRAATAWVLARFNRPDQDDLDALVHEMCAREPTFALLLKETIAERVVIERTCPTAPPGSYKRARGALRNVE